MTTTTLISKEPALVRGMTDDEIAEALAKGREMARKPLSPKVRFIVRAVYAAGTIGTGYGLWDLLVHLGRFNPYFAFGIVLLYEAFAVGAFTFSTRARLRGQSGLWLRSVAYLGSLSTATAQLLFHWADNRIQAVLLPMASVLSLVFYTLDVYDKHAAVFMALDELDRRARAARAAERAERRAYWRAKGRSAAKKEERGHIVTVGERRREVEANIKMAELDAMDPMKEIEGEVVGSTSGTPAIGRPTSGAPATTVIGDDRHAEYMRQLPSWSLCVEYMAQQFPTHGVAELMRVLAPYGCTLGRTTVTDARSRGLSLNGKTPSALPQRPLEVEAVPAD